MPAQRKSGKGFFGDLIRKVARPVAHWGVDKIGDALGAGLKRRRKAGSGLVKGSAQAKAHMAKVRACIGRRKRGGSMISAGY